VPYRLPEVVKADHVLIVEGEKDVESLRALNLAASCNPMGAGKWRAEYNGYFNGKSVSIILDNDEPGRKHARAKSLAGTARLVKMWTFPDCLTR
jgi:putative DNA primase/helicase